ncbi:MAG: hypothetical protein RL240_1797 [Planctomycetota bacterium]|jgi:hypothetical protein
MIRNSTSVCALVVGGWVFGILAGTRLQGQELDPKKVDFFETKIRPVLVEKCYECHSAKTPAGELGGKLRLDTSGGMLRGGTLGPLLQAGQGQSSLLIKVIEYTEPGLQMPPDGKLTDEQIADFRRWVEEGAVDPRSEKDSPEMIDPAKDIATQTANHWAYRPLGDAPVIEGVEGLGNDSDLVDRSIAQELKKSGLGFSPEADRRTLVRRLYYDLLGLSPSLEEIAQVQADQREDWYVRLVDRLLESPHFGERMARRWMDVVRYADNKGYVFQEDREYRHAYRYRNWLIRAFNEDLPYDQFLRYQLIADRLDPQNEQGHLDAMGMLTLGRRFLNNPHDVADDRIDVVTRGLMGVTAACARCHDHKFDPVSMADYYSLHGAFLGSEEPGGDPSPMRMVDKGSQGGTRILLRGNPGNPGAEVARRFMVFLNPQSPVEMKTGSGRLEMAEAITDGRNPLTPRVFANRLWGWLFGVPLVDTPSDFGLRCAAPVQQVVLDSLARDLVQSGWSVKGLVRRMVLTRTYRQQSVHREDAFAIDPENRLWWRAQRKRMDFESLRDSLLLATGQLDRAIGGESVSIQTPPFPKRRTLYAYIDRQNLPQLFRSFDFASPDAHVPSRAQTTVPQQGLVLMNSDFVQAMLPEMALKASGMGIDAGVDYLFKQVLAREGTSEEKHMLRELIEANDMRLPDVPQNQWTYGVAKIDPQTGSIEGFRQLPRFHQNRWQGMKDELPDPDLDWALLSNLGGHPGGRADLAVVRRWTAMQAGELRVRGMLKHVPEQGDGVRGTVSVRGVQKVGQWEVRHGESATNVDGITVAIGDTIDFVVDCFGDANSDTFEWKVRIVSSDEQKVRSSSERGFGGVQPAALSPWEQALQALLLTNEFCFID